MLRWFRLLVIALLLPAYSLAAIVMPSVADSAVPVPFSVGEEPASEAEVTALLAELGDTTDDMSDHCLSRPSVLAKVEPPAAPPCLGRRLAIDAPRAPPLRPPRA